MRERATRSNCSKRDNQQVQRARRQKPRSVCAAVGRPRRAARAKKEWRHSGRKKKAGSAYLRDIPMRHCLKRAGSMLRRGHHPQVLAGPSCLPGCAAQPLQQQASASCSAGLPRSIRLGASYSRGSAGVPGRLESRRPPLRCRRIAPVCFRSRRGRWAAARGAARGPERGAPAAFLGHSHLGM